MLGGVKHKKVRFLNDAGWRKPQEGKDFQAIFPEVEMAIPPEGTPKLGHGAGCAGCPGARSRSPGQTPLTAHALYG